MMRMHTGNQVESVTGNPTRRLKATVVCSDVTYCGSTMRVHAFMIRICVWHSFRVHREIFWRCHNVARIAVMTRRAGRNVRKNGERKFEHKISPLLIKTDYGLSRDNDFFCGISDRPSIDYFCYARTSNMYYSDRDVNPVTGLHPEVNILTNAKHTKNIFEISFKRYLVSKILMFFWMFFITYIRNTESKTVKNLLYNNLCNYNYYIIAITRRELSTYSRRPSDTGD